MKCCANWFLACAVLALCPSLAMSADEATFSGSAAFTVTLDSVAFPSGGPADEGVAFEIDLITEDTFSDLFLEGDAIGSHTSDVDSTVADGSVFVEASASAPFGYAEGFGESFVLVEITNLSAEPLTFDFSYALDAIADAGLTPVPGGFSDALMFAEAGFGITTAGSPVFGDIFDVFAFAEADALFGPPSDADSVIDTFSFDLLVGATVEVDLYAGIDGFALVVPEPASVGLLGLLGMLTIGQRRRAAA